MIAPKLLPCLVVAAFTGLCACATSSEEFADDGSEIVGDAVEQPFRDLNLIRDDLPPLLRTAADAPYDDTGLTSCARIAGQIGEIEALLGPDIDTGVTEEDSDAVAIASDALRGLVGLPFRGVVRRLTGAHDRDTEIRRAVLAGMVRRGYLKGLADERGCVIQDR